MMMLIFCEVRDQGSDAGDDIPVAYIDKAINNITNRKQNNNCLALNMEIN